MGAPGTVPGPATHVTQGADIVCVSRDRSMLLLRPHKLRAQELRTMYPNLNSLHCPGRLRLFAQTLMPARDLLQNPVWQGEELGQPIPASPHSGMK